MTTTPRCLALIALLFVGPSLGQGPRPIQVELLEPLRFGHLVSSAVSSGGATVNPGDGGIHTRGGADRAGGFFGAARMRLRGQPGAHFFVRLPAEVPMVGAGGQVTLRDLRSLPADTGTFDLNGNAEVSIGGTAFFEARTTGGEYLAQLDIWVDYQ